MTKPLKEFLEEVADEIIRVEYPTYEKAIPPIKRSIITKKAKIYAILQATIKEVITSRVEWLLNEINDALKMNEKEMKETEDPDSWEFGFCEGYEGAMKYVKNTLIKTAFEDVMKGGDEWGAEEMTSKYRKYKHLLEEIATAFRHADKEFGTLQFEKKTLLNDVGKMLETLTFLLRKYDLANENEKLKIRKIAHDLRQKFTDVMKDE